MVLDVTIFVVDITFVIKVMKPDIFNDGDIHLRPRFYGPLVVHSIG